MAVIRINKTADYTVMSNAHFKEKGMSLKAKGLLSLMLSLPDDWDYSINGLVALSKDGKDSVMSALSELEQFGYLKRTKIVNDKGQFDGYDYDIYETPYSEANREEPPFTEKPYSENPNTEKPNSENPLQLNTNTLNTKISSTKKSNTNKAASGIDTVLAQWANNNVPEYSRDGILDLLREWVSIRKQKRAPSTVRAIELNLGKLIPCASSSNMTVSKYLEEVICRGWQAFYEIPNMNGGQSNGKYARLTGGDTDYSRGEETLGTML